MATTQFQKEKRLLQLAVFIAACVPIAAGVVGMTSGIAVFDTQPDISLDSHFRYLSGLLCGLGLNFWWMVPSIEKHTATVRALTVLVMLGGAARLASATFIAVPSLPMQLAIVMELVVTPLLCLWQARIVRVAAIGGT